MAQSLQAAGCRLRTHHEVYGDRDQEVPDAEWLEFCGREGLPVLTKDLRLRYRPGEIGAIDAFAYADPGPFVYAVQSNRIVRIFP